MTDVAENPARAGSGRYAIVAIVLHWTIAALILTQIMLAGRMEDRSPEAFAVTQLHKSVGITILLLSLARLAWRLMNPPPPMPKTMARWEQTLAAITHAGFYLVMIGMPLTGWIMVSTSRIEIPTLLYGAVPWPDLPGTDGLSRGAREGLHAFGEAGHDLIIKGFYGLIGLHVAGALKHQLFSRDEPVLARMAPGARAGRWLEPRLALIALAAAATAAFGILVSPPVPGVRAPPMPPAREAEPIEAAGPEEPLAPAPVAAQAAAPASPAVAAPQAPAEPVAWRLEDGSKLEFETAWGQTKIEGAFRRFTADIRFSPAALDRSRVSVTIDVSSVATGDAQRDEALPGYDFFNIDEHPRASFVADRFEQVGDDRYVARGRLTLRGVTRPVNLPFELKIDGDRARVRGETSLDRTAFGVGQGEFAATDQVPAQVKIEVDLRARR
jgi:cytochrome b561/polyisoprenoid-binding protein YceI